MSHFARPGQPKLRPRTREATTLECIYVLDKIDSDPDRQPVKIAEMNISRISQVIPPTEMGKEPGLLNYGVGGKACYMLPKYGPARGQFHVSSSSSMPQALICEIESPDVFYIQSSDTTFLNLMEIDMTGWYNKETFAYEKDGVQLGGFYAAYTEETKQWHRACVSGVMLNEPETTYFSQLLDYGKHVIVKLPDLLPLHRKYLSLPTQACEARLYDETEPRQIWTTEEIKKFKSDYLMKSAKVFVLEEDEEDKTKLFRSVSLAMVKINDPKEKLYTLGGKLKIPLEETEDEPTKAND